MNYALSTPALNGEVVTQGHSDYCQANGHMSYTKDGVVQNLCPRCGETTATEVTAEKAVGDVTGAIIMRGTQRIGYANRIRGMIHYRGTDGARMVVASTDSGFTALTRKLSA